MIFEDDFNKYLVDIPAGKLHIRRYETESVNTDENFWLIYQQNNISSNISDGMQNTFASQLKIKNGKPFHMCKLYQFNSISFVLLLFYQQLNLNFSYWMHRVKATNNSRKEQGSTAYDHKFSHDDSHFQRVYVEFGQLWYAIKFTDDELNAGSTFCKRAFRGPDGKTFHFLWLCFEFTLHVKNN